MVGSQGPLHVTNLWTTVWYVCVKNTELCYVRYLCICTFWRENPTDNRNWDQTKTICKHLTLIFYISLRSNNNYLHVQWLKETHKTRGRITTKRKSLIRQQKKNTRRTTTKRTPLMLTKKLSVYNCNSENLFWMINIITAYIHKKIEWQT